MSDELEKRASDAEREQAVARLREASAEGRLTLEELAERTALAYRAQSRAELESVTADLPAAVPGVRPVSGKRRIHVAIFGPLSRAGRRALADETVAVSMFGPMRLDLRGASFPSAEATLTVFSLFGPVFVTVPDHVDVETSLFALFGPVHEDPAGDVPPGAPRLKVRSLSLFGPIFVKVVRR